MTPPPGDQGPLHRSARYYRVARRRGWKRPVFAWVAWLAIAATAATAYGAWAFVDTTITSVTSNTVRVKKFRQVAAPVEPGEPATILLLGSDTRGKEKGDVGRSDSMIMVRVDTRQGFISMLSFPRDSYVDIPGIGRDKLNAAYSYGEQRQSGGGPAMVSKTLTQLTGQKINYYANIDFKGFVSVVDDLDGVYIDVDHRYFNDNSGPEKYEMIDLKPGYQLLNGEDALDFVRFRHKDSDFARIVRQQMFLSELKRKVKGDLGNAFRAPLLIKKLTKNAETSIEGDRLLELLPFAVNLPDNRVFRRTVEGGLSMTSDGQSIVVLDQGEVQAAVQEWLQPPFVAAAPQKKVDPTTVEVRVLNGSGRGMVADTVTNLLAGRGYVATAAGNAKDFSYTSSTVLFDPSAPTSQAAATAVRELMGPSAGMTSVPSSALGGADIVVIVGTDFTGELYTPPPTEKVVEKAEVVHTTSLVKPFRDIQRRTGIPLAVPTRIAAGSSVEDIYVYRIGDAVRGPWAVKVVFRMPDAGGYARYWGIMATTMKEPPILLGKVGTLKKADGLGEISTYYNGKLLVRDAFRYKGVNYWVSNTLDKRAPLNSLTVHSIARSFRPVRAAKLPKGTVDTAIRIEDDPSTP